MRTDWLMTTNTSTKELVPGRSAIACSPEENLLGVDDFFTPNLSKETSIDTWSFPGKRMRNMVNRIFLVLRIILLMPAVAVLLLAAWFFCAMHRKRKTVSGSLFVTLFILASQ
jgi:hypothetical protein